MTNCGQLSIFDGTKPLKITKPIRLIELFAGIGSQAKALKRLGADFEHYRVVEFDKYAIASYNAIHGTNFPTLDITQISGADLGIVDADKYDYIMTYSFPCTDLSKAGKQQGMSRESGTRSGLLWEVERLLKEVQHLPQFLLMENVPDVLSDKFVKDFADWVAFLDSLGYTSKWAIINAKEQGVPQNRERCFMLSWLEKDCYYLFPQPKKLTKRLKDVLETQVDEKYYLSDRALKGALNTTYQSGTLESRLPKNGIVPTIRARDWKDPKLVEVEQEQDDITLQQVGQLEGNFESTGRIYSADGLCPTINTCGGGQREPKIVEPITTRGADVAGAIRATIYKQVERNLIENLTNGLGYEGVLEPIAYDEQNGYCRQDGCVGTLTTDGSSPKHNNRIIEPIGGSELKRELCNQLLEQGLVEEGDFIRHSYTNDRLQNGIKNMQRTECKDKLSPTLDTRCDCLGVVVKEDIDEPTFVERAIQDSNGEVMSFDPSQSKTFGYRKPLPVARTLRAGNSSVGSVIENYRIRKLTPLECWRLMDFDDTDFEKASQVCSRSQLYKQAGNSIVVAVLQAILAPLLTGGTA